MVAQAAGVYPEQGEGESDNEVEGDVTMDSTLDSTGVHMIYDKKLMLKDSTCKVHFLVMLSA